MSGVLEIIDSSLNTATVRVWCNERYCWRMLLQALILSEMPVDKRRFFLELGVMGHEVMRNDRISNIESRSIMCTNLSQNVLLMSKPRNVRRHFDFYIRPTWSRRTMSTMVFGLSRRRRKVYQQSKSSSNLRTDSFSDLTVRISKYMLKQQHQMSDSDVIIIRQ
jgi:hypothetical protein